jgi:tRNA-Thr(GGU) m(6)t(6)A37 methyltransferase TsaA
MWRVTPVRSPRQTRRSAVLWTAATLALLALCGALQLAAAAPPAQDAAADLEASYQVHAIGWVRKRDGRTLIEVNERYRPALLGVDQLRHIWVLYWFDRNDTPAQRAILQVHPRGDPANPLRGVFATRAPVRPNLIALSRCRVLSVVGNVIEIDGIDAFPDTPVLDIKP